MKTTVISHTIRSVKELEVDLNVCSILKSERMGFDLNCRNRISRFLDWNRMSIRIYWVILIYTCKFVCPYLTRNLTICCSVILELMTPAVLVLNLWWRREVPTCLIIRPINWLWSNHVEPFIYYFIIFNRDFSTVSKWKITADTQKLLFTWPTNTKMYQLDTRI